MYLHRAARHYDRKISTFSRELRYLLDTVLKSVFITHLALLKSAPYRGEISVRSHGIYNNRRVEKIKCRAHKRKVKGSELRNLLAMTSAALFYSTISETPMA
jgi:hypothetical protein